MVFPLRRRICPVKCRYFLHFASRRAGPDSRETPENCGFVTMAPILRVNGAGALLQEIDMNLLSFRGLMVAACMAGGVVLASGTANAITISTFEGTVVGSAFNGTVGTGSFT